tara:strand:- start:27 stop:287 length:261 start_codon:yes stop_codon:yes gene_type:complete
MTIKKNKKQKDKINLFQERLSTLESLKMQCKALEKVNTELIKKIDSKGIDAYYSVNSDVLRHAISIWKSCIRLAELKKIERDVKIS